MALIELETVTVDEDGNGQIEPVFVNSSNILTVHPGGPVPDGFEDSDDVTAIIMQGNSVIAVTQTPQEIRQAIDDEWARVRNRQSKSDNIRWKDADGKSEKAVEKTA